MDRHDMTTQTRQLNRSSGRFRGGSEHGSSHEGGMSRRGPMGALLIGAGLAAAVLFFRSRGQQQSQDNGRYGWSGQEGGMAHRHQQGTREAKKNTLLAWLNDAYAMEKSLVQTLKGHAADAKEHPRISERLHRHMEESRHHAELVKGCIERLGGSVSTIKTGLSTMMGAVQSVGMMPAKDSLVKNMLADASAEQLEIASYRGIIAAADEIGDTETAEIARQILHDEEQMSRWLEQQLPHAVRDQMAHA